MFNRESQFINIIKHGTQLKINYKKLNHKEIITTNQAAFLLHENVLTKDIIFKIDTLKQNVLKTYISTLLISQDERIVKNSSVFDKDEYLSSKLNNAYKLLMKKNRLFELEHYFKKVGFDYVFSPYHILNMHNEENPAKNSLCVFIVNYHAYIIITNEKNQIVFNKIIKISSFEDIKKSGFYENEVVGQKLYDEVYYLELTNLIKEAINEYYSKKGVSFIEKITILYNQKQLDSSQINTFKEEMLLDVNYHYISIDDCLYDLSHEKESHLKSFVIPKIKSLSLFKPFVLASLLFIIAALGFIYYDRNKHTNDNKLKIEESNFEKEKITLPNHIIKNRNIQKVLLSHFDMIPYNVILKELNLESMNSSLEIEVLDDDTYLKVMYPRFLKLYKRSNIVYAKLDEIVKTALIKNEDKLFFKSKIKTDLPSYISDEFIPLKRVSEQIKNIFPSTTVIKYVSTFNSNISTFNYEISLNLKTPLDFFDLIDNLNEELYSINLSYPISLVLDENEELKIKFLLQFHQNN